MTYEGERMVYIPVIHRNTPLPVSRSEVFSTYRDGQTEVDVTVYEGEDPVPERNTFIGQFRVEGLRKGPAGNPIIVNFTLDLNGMLKVTATEKETGLNKMVTLDTRGAESTFEFDKARENIRSLIEEPAENRAVGGEAGTGHADDQSLLHTAKELRKRAEALLQKGVSEDDASEIHDLLKQSAEAVKVHEREKLSELNDRLSDIIFYLED
jgi:molecular chaperone DnaK